MSIQTVSIEPGDVLEVQQVGGDLQASGWSQRQLQAEGDHVQMQKRPGSVLIRCRGDLKLSIPETADIILSSIGGDVRVHDLAGSVELRVVGGDASMRDLRGSVKLNGVIGGKLRMENVSDVWVNHTPEGRARDLAESIRRKIEHATRGAEIKMRRAEQKLQHAQLRSQRFDAGRWRYHGGQEVPDAAPGASEEERLAVLQMLHDKKITSEQADQLLAALEGERS